MVNREKVISEVKKGASFRQTSIKYKIPLSTVVNWCNEEGIKSQHSRTPTKATDDELLKMESGIINSYLFSKESNELIISAKKDVEDLIEGHFKMKEE